jgi:hypothetical protein
MAASDQLYVSNQLYRGRIDKAVGANWVNLDDFSKAAGLDKLHHGLLQSGKLPLTCNGVSFSIPAEQKKDGLYVDGRALTEGLGGSWIFNNSLGLTNVSFLAVASAAEKASTTATPSATPAGLPQPQKVSPLKVETFSYTNPTLPVGSKNAAAARALVHVTGTVVLHNGGDSYADDVKEVLHIQDGYGNDIDTQSHVLGKMDAGKTDTWEWSWDNLNNLDIHPVIEVEHMPYYSKADRDAYEKAKVAIPLGKKVSFKATPTEGIPAASATEGASSSGYQAAPNASSTGYVAPTQSSAPPGFGPGDGSSSSSTTAPSATSTNPPGF